MVHVIIKEYVDKENVKLLINYIKTLHCKYSVETIDNNDVSIVVIEDIINNNDVSMHNRILSKTANLNMLNGVTVVEYFNDNSLPITTTNLNNYIKSLENEFENLILKKFNLNNDIEIYEEDYTGDLEEELEELEELITVKSNFIELLYSFAYRLDIVV